MLTSVGFKKDINSCSKANSPSSLKAGNMFNRAKAIVNEEMYL
jgi:hypothetical protein